MVVDGCRRIRSPIDCVGTPTPPKLTEPGEEKEEAEGTYGGATPVAAAEDEKEAASSSCAVVEVARIGD